MIFPSNYSYGPENDSTKTHINAVKNGSITSIQQLISKNGRRKKIFCCSSWPMRWARNGQEFPKP